MRPMMYFQTNCIIYFVIENFFYFNIFTIEFFKKMWNNANFTSKYRNKMFIKLLSLSIQFYQNPVATNYDGRFKYGLTI